MLFTSKSWRTTTCPPLAWMRLPKLSATPLPKVSLSDQTATFVALRVSIEKSAIAGPCTVSGAAMRK